MTLNPLAVIVAAYNEEEGIAPTICELKEFLNNPKLVVVDGRSSDRTLEIAKDLGAEVLIQEGRGKGDAISKGLAHLYGETSYVVITDADYTYPAKYLKEMINVLDANSNIGTVLGDRFSEDMNKNLLGINFLLETEFLLLFKES
jgi:dolichol-phosphate mannosyltransferase